MFAAVLRHRLMKVVFRYLSGVVLFEQLPGFVSKRGRLHEEVHYGAAGHGASFQSSDKFRRTGYHRNGAVLHAGEIFTADFHHLTIWNFFDDVSHDGDRRFFGHFGYRASGHLRRSAGGGVHLKGSIVTALAATRKMFAVVGDASYVCSPTQLSALARTSRAGKHSHSL